MSVDGLIDVLEDAGPGGFRRPIFRSPHARPHRFVIGDARGWGEPHSTEALGVILTDARLPHSQFSSTPVSKDLERFLPPRKDQRINEAETLWVWVVFRTWQKHLAGANVTVAVHSSPAQGGLRKGMSGSAVLCCLSAEVWRLARHIDARIWVERVPSAANPADPHSWLSTADALQRGWTHVKQSHVPVAWHFDPRTRGR